MFTYKQRYKPRTTREYTKSDLTVYDSAGNTALNALSVYGKSEVVDGAIKSAGDVGYLHVRTESKNSLNITATTQTINGITFTINPDKTVTVNGTATATAKLNLAQYILIGRTVRYLSGSPVAGSAETIRLGFPGYGYISVANAPLEIDRRSSDTDWSNFVYIEVAEGYTANNLLFKPMISYSNDITYEPYIGDTMAAFTTGTPLYGISDTVRDAMNWNGLSGEVTKKCNKVRLADLTNWNIAGEADHTFYRGFSAQGIKANGAILSNNYINVPITQISTTDKCIAINSTSILIRDTDYTTVSDFVASLGDAELVYELATPTTEPLTQTENESLASLRTFDGTTHFTNNATTDMTANYTIKAPTIS